MTIGGCIFYTGGAMMMGKGTIHASSMKQKLNTWISTEAEIIGVNDLMPQAMRVPCNVKRKERNQVANIPGTLVSATSLSPTESSQ
eukprot:2535348-Ditylum_brightwellii.AAC.2